MRRFAVLTLLLVCVFAVAPLAHAQSFAGPVVPDCGGGPCQACHLVKLADNLLRFGIYIATVIATLILVYAGFLYITSAANPGHIDQARKMFWNVLIGFIIILVAWIAVATLLRVFLGQGRALPWDQLACNVVDNSTPGSQLNSDGTLSTGATPGTPDVYANCLAATEDGVCTQFDQQPTAGDTCLDTDPEGRCLEWTSASASPNSPSTFYNPGGPYCLDENPLGGCTNWSNTPNNPTSEAALRADLASANITVNKEACPDGVAFQAVSGGCTSVAGMDSSAVSGLKLITSTCDCPIIISGATEAGHQTHKTGLDVDLEVTPVQSYVDSMIPFATNITRNSAGQVATFTDPYGNKWTREGAGFTSFAATTGSHWHVSFAQK